MKNLDFIILHKCFRSIGSILYNGAYFYFPDDITFCRIGTNVFNIFPTDISISGKYAYYMVNSTLIAGQLNVRRI